MLDMEGSQIPGMFISLDGPIANAAGCRDRNLPARTLASHPYKGISGRA